MQTREQKRANKAYQQVESILGSTKKAEYGRTAHKLPILIRQSGLAQALVFFEAKGSDGGLLAHLGDHLYEAGLLAEGTKTALLERSRKADLREYMHLTREVQAALLWYKRFAQSVLKVSADDEESGS